MRNSEVLAYFQLLGKYQQCGSMSTKFDFKQKTDYPIQNGPRETLC